MHDTSCVGKVVETLPDKLCLLVSLLPVTELDAVDGTGAAVTAPITLVITSMEILKCILEISKAARCPSATVGNSTVTGNLA